jgi:ATP-dependent NAD(P)H-hydrate dehydratase
MESLEPACLRQAYRKLIPDWETLQHKGAAGRVAVVGGCLEYTGAPYLAAMSATRAGADLAYIFCERDAALPLKAYAPDLIVIPTYTASSPEKTHDNAHESNAVSRFTSWLPRLHAVCFGPGLGRDPGVLAAVQAFMVHALKQPVPLVIDADALFLLSQFGPPKTQTALATALDERRSLGSRDASARKRGTAPVVITPNAVEMRRLLQSFDCQTPEEWLHRVLVPGDVVIEKGQHDRIHLFDEASIDPSGMTVAVSCVEEGSPRRCGGQGDILSGILVTSLAWMRLHRDPPGAFVAAYGASMLTRRAARRAFATNYRAMTATDVLEEVGPAFHDFENSEEA